MCCPLFFTTSEMHSLTTTQKHWGKNLISTWIWKMICCKQGVGKKRTCELKSFYGMETHFCFITTCNKTIFYIGSWFSSWKALFCLLLGVTFKTKLWVCLFFCWVWLPEQVASSEDGEFSFLFFFGGTSMKYLLISVTDGPSEIVSWRATPLPDRPSVWIQLNAFISHTVKKI